MSKNSYNVPTVKIVPTQNRGIVENKSNPEIDFVIRHCNNHVNSVQYIREMIDLCTNRLSDFISKKTFIADKYYFMPFVFAKNKKMIAMIAQMPENIKPEDVIDLVRKCGITDEEEIACKRECMREFHDRLYWIEIHPDERSKGVRL